MSLKSLFSSSSRKSTDPHESTASGPQCRYIMDSGLRCRRQPSVTGSGICLHHENQILQLRRDEAQDLANEALSGISDFTSALNINQVLGPILALALQRRYSPRELDSFTRSLRLLLKSQPDAAVEVSLAKWRKSLASTRSSQTPATSTDRESDHGVVAAGLARPGFAEAEAQESPDHSKHEHPAPGAPDAELASGLGTAAQEATRSAERPPQTQAASHPISNPLSLRQRIEEIYRGDRPPQPKKAPVPPPSPEPEPKPEPEPDDHVVWLGPRPTILLPNVPPFLRRKK